MRRSQEAFDLVFSESMAIEELRLREFQIRQGKLKKGSRHTFTAQVLGKPAQYICEFDGEADTITVSYEKGNGRIVLRNDGKRNRVFYWRGSDGQVVIDDKAFSKAS